MTDYWGPDSFREYFGHPPTPAMAKAAEGKLALRLGEVAKRCSLSRRTIERALARGEFPKPDRKVGRAAIWSVATIERWLKGESQ
jgi:predicted DNA-binding transcriptional regulator AlpA